MANVTVTVSIPRRIYKHLRDQLRPMLKNPRRDPISGVIVTEPMFPGDDPVAEWIRQTVAMNVKQVIRSSEQRPADVDRLAQAIEDAQKRLDEYCSPEVSSSGYENVDSE